jgi:plastocyanin
MKLLNFTVIILRIAVITGLSSCMKDLDLGPDFFNFPQYVYDTTSVTITSYGFDPDTLDVKIGSYVTWYNWDSSRHNLVSANDTSFHSGNMDQWSSYSFLFKNAGTFRYNCSIHNEAGIIIIIP